jgi:hypothetical protein
MLASERNALVNEVDAAKAARAGSVGGPETGS